MEQESGVVISGVVEIINAKISKESNGKTYNSQLIVVTDNSNAKYPRKIAITLKGHAIEKLNIGQNVSLTCSLESKEWNGRWFTEITCWNI